MTNDDNANYEASAAEVKVGDKEEVKDEPKEEYALVRQTEIALQKKYVEALIKAKPGLGDKSQQIAFDLVNVGLTPNEVLMLINQVYSPSGLEGRGQGTRVKFFAEAVKKRYGDHRLEKCSYSPALFRGLIAQIGEAVEMRDTVNDYLTGRTSISFDDTLAYQEIGLGPEAILGYVERLVSESGVSETAAIMKIKDAARKVESQRIANLEAILFPSEMDSFVAKIMEGGTHDEDESEGVK